MVKILNRYEKIKNKMINSGKLQNNKFKTYKKKLTKQNKKINISSQFKKHLN